MIDQKRQEEIDSATKNNPVDLTDAEAAELRMRNKNRFQTDVGAGKYRLRAKAGTPAARALEMSQAGYTSRDIGDALELTPDAVTRILERTYEG
jgi:hypothetical protein